METQSVSTIIVNYSLLIVNYFRQLIFCTKNKYPFVTLAQKRKKLEKV